MENKCLTLPCSKCCEDIIIPLGYKIPEDMKRWIELHGIETESKAIKLKVSCLKLKDGKCSIYEDRPDICREYICDL